MKADGNEGTMSAVMREHVVSDTEGCWCEPVTVEVAPRRSYRVEHVGGCNDLCGDGGHWLDCAAGDPS